MLARPVLGPAAAAVLALALAVPGCGRRAEPAEPASTAEPASSEAAAGDPPRAGDGASPPPAGWADVAVRIPDAVLDLRYATDRNFTGVVLYPVARCLLRGPVADDLVRAAAALRRSGHRLVVWDCYRPAAIQDRLWQQVPDPRYVAEPRRDAAGRPVEGSRHSRGAALDVGLADRDGNLVALPTDHDDFTPAASGARARGAAARNLAVLRAAMTAADFELLATEWWHFDHAGWRRFALADFPLVE